MHRQRAVREIMGIDTNPLKTDILDRNQAGGKIVIRKSVEMVKEEPYNTQVKISFNEEMF